MFYKYSCSCTIAIFISLISKNSIMITNVTQKVQRQYIFFDFKNILPFNNCFLLFSPFPSLHSPFEENPHHHSSLFIRSSSFLPFSVILPPSAYGLRPITYSSFFRLETPFFPFLTLLYYTMSQSLIYPFYTNRPRFI